MNNQATEKQIEFINTLIHQQIDNLNKLSVPSDGMLLWQPPAEGMIEYIESWLSLDFSTFTKSEASELIDFLKDPIAGHHVEKFAFEFGSGMYTLTAEQAARNNRRFDVDYYVEGENLTGIRVILVKIARMLPEPAPAPTASAPARPLTIVEVQDLIVDFNNGGREFGRVAPVETAAEDVEIFARTEVLAHPDANRFDEEDVETFIRAFVDGARGITALS